MPAADAAPQQPKKPAPNPTKTALDKAAALVKEGKPEEALTVLRAATLDVKKRRGVGHPDLLPIYDAAGEILVETDPRGKAESLYEKSIVIRELLQKKGKLDDEAKLGRTWLLLARVRLAAGKLEQALAAAGSAVKTLERAGGPRHDDTQAAWEVFDRIVVSFEDLLGPEDPATRQARDRSASLAEAHGRLASAIDTRRVSLAGLQNRGGNDSPAALEEFGRIQRLLLEAGRTDEAIAEQEKFIESVTADEPEKKSAPARLEALRLLGEMQLAAESFTAATAAFDKALEVSKTLFDGNHPEVRLDRLNVLAVEARRGRFPDAATVGEIVAGPDEEECSPALVRALARAAEILAAGGDAEAARGFAARAIECDADLPTIPAGTRIENRLLLARCLLQVRNTAEARPLLEESLREADSRFGPGDARTLLLTLALAECNALEGLPDEATALLRRVLDRGLPRRDFARDREFARVVGVVARVAPAQSGTPTAPAAPSLWDDFVATRQASHGDDHAAAALARVLAGGDSLAAGAPRDAVRFLEPAVTALEAALGAKHPDVAAALLLLGVAQREEEQRDEATRSLERALGIWEEKAGPDHDATLAATQALALTKVAEDRAAEALPLLERLQATYAKRPPPTSWNVAQVLVPLAGAYLEKSDKDRARETATSAAKLDCWQPQRGAPAAELEHRALALADLAGFLKSVGEEEAGTDAQRRARGIATRLDNPRRVFTEIDRRAAARN
jgi:tetratricopeptide (TPR) repeat protein